MVLSSFNWLSFCWVCSCDEWSTGCMAIISTVAFRQMDALVYITLLLCMKVTQFLAAKRPLLMPSLQASSAFAKAFVQCQSCNSCRPSHGSCPWNPWIFPLGLVPAIFRSPSFFLQRNDSLKKGKLVIRSTPTICPAFGRCVSSYHVHPFATIGFGHHYPPSYLRRWEQPRLPAPKYILHIWIYFDLIYIDPCDRSLRDLKGPMSIKTKLKVFPWWGATQEQRAIKIAIVSKLGYPAK